MPYTNRKVVIVLSVIQFVLSTGATVYWVSRGPNDRNQDGRISTDEYIHQNMLLLTGLLSFASSIRDLHRPVISCLSKCKDFFWVDNNMPTSSEIKLTHQLEEDFENLNMEQKQLLVEKNLAESTTTLKFTCPITLSLIVKPGVLKVNDKNKQSVNEYYEYSYIKQILNEDIILSPTTKREIISNKIFIDENINKELSEYKIQLRNEIDNILNVNKSLQK
ncbi:MAG: hypothetical protein HYX60_07705 [Legionella longbeachae]|nr:hypothetical protein [Legionella longbeachae]